MSNLNPCPFCGSVDVSNTKRECYEDARNHAIDKDGILYEFKAGLKPVNMDIRVVEWCTGLRDCKCTEEFPEGQLIYEGDVVVFPHWEKPTPEIVIWCRLDSCWTFGSFNDDLTLDAADRCKIIGTIHDKEA